jgi:hypothetical protein
MTVMPLFYGVGQETFPLNVEYFGEFPGNLLCDG